MNQLTEQALAQIRDDLPRLWRAVYQGCLQAGFDEHQSFVLLQTYILGQNPFGINAGNAQGPKTDTE